MPISLLQSTAYISAFGTYVPEHVLTNAYFESIVDTNDEWITQRTGMKERRKAAPHEYASDLGCQAVRQMETNYPGCLQNVDAILVATSTPDTFFPNTAALIQAKLGLSNCFTLDISNACAGFVSSMQLALGLLDSGMHKKVLVIGSETLTKTVDYTDRSSCILFGDGAGAIMLEQAAHQAQDSGKPAFIASYAVTQGDLRGAVYRSACADRIGNESILDHGMLVQNGREVYKWALSQIPQGVTQLLQAADMSIQDIDLFVPHSANLRMIESICDRAEIPMDRTLTSMQKCGNTSAASIPLAIQQGIEDGRVQTDKLMLLYGFGGGLSQAALLVRWTL
ncbi:beta-ketoacyl-ACP synthase 3 [Paenibacillus marinisediminis]